MTIDYDTTRTALYHPELRDTVFAPGQAYTTLQLGVEAARLAYVRWEEATQAERGRLTAALARCGFGQLATFGHAITGAQAFGCIRQGDGAAIVAFRGTQPDEAADLGADLTAYMMPWTEAGGMVHAGFAHATRTLLPEITDWIASNKVQPGNLTLAGHSLGAAMATLAASVLRPVRMVALGSPRVGDAGFVATLAGVECARIVNCCDVVTELPPALGNYVHTAPFTYITGDGDTRLIADPPSALVSADQLRARLDYVQQHAWRSGSVLVRELADHAPINYVRAYFR